MNTSTDRKPGHAWRITLSCAGLAVMGWSGAGAVSQPADSSASGQAAASIPAQWQEHELRFHYFGFTTYYSCMGLEDRLKELLRQLGASDVMVSANGCMGFNEISKSISARIKVRMPVGEGAGTGTAFSAQNTPVELRASRMGESGSGDCELLEQVRDQLLPPLKLSLVKDDLLCVPGQFVGGARSLKVMALLPAPARP